jgi:shikimate dehydrogenase
VIYALIEEGVKKIYLSNRTIEKAETLAQKFLPFVEVISWHEKENFLKHSNLLVNTTSLGMTGKPDLEIDIHTLPQTSLVTDIVYSPLMTNLLKKAQAQNLHIITGIGMLLHQARPAFQAWSGILPDIDATLEAQVLA